jgi:hypothetical protein
MVLGTHFTRASVVVVPDYLTTSPSVPVTPYRDVFGNCGAAASSLLPAECSCRPMASFVTPACRTHPYLRPQHAGQFQGLDGGGQLACERGASFRVGDDQKVVNFIQILFANERILDLTEAPDQSDRAFNLTC